MAFQFYERPSSRASTSDPPSVVMNYVAQGSSDAAMVRVYAMSATAAIVATTQGIMYRQDISIEPSGAEVWYVTVPYGPRKRELGSYRWNFDTTGGTVHITNSKATTAIYASSGVVTDPDFKGAIGVHGPNDDVEGTDIVVPAMKMTVHFKHPLGMITIARAKVLASYTGMVNSTNFMTFAPGEVLFLGASGSEGTDAEAEVQYQFAVSGNVTGLTFGDIANVAKKGWEYAWIRYTPDVDNGRAVKVPQFVYVERVYNTFDMAAVLGFG